MQEAPLERGFGYQLILPVPSVGLEPTLDGLISGRARDGAGPVKAAVADRGVQSRHCCVA